MKIVRIAIPLALFLSSGSVGYVSYRLIQLHPAPILLPRWIVQYTTFAKLVSGADAIYVGTVTDLSPGRTVPDPDGEVEVQFTNMTVNVEWANGTSVKLRSETLELLGDYWGGGDGAKIVGYPDFQLGEKYMIFTWRLPSGMQTVLNNQGGYWINDGLLDAGDPKDRIAQMLHGRTLEAAKGMVVAEKQRGLLRQP